MNKFALMLFIIFGILLIGQARAVCDIQPTAWNVGEIDPDSTTEKTFTIDASGSSCEVTADSEYITFSETIFQNTTSSFKAVLTLPKDIKSGSYTEHIKVNNNDAVTVTYTVLPVGRLEPTFSWTKKQFEQGVEATQILNLRNRYNTEIEITHISLEGDIITTKQGVTKPVYIKEGKAGFLQSGEDVSITLGFNTVNVKPGDYSVKLLITYYVENERKTLEISLEISVLKTFEETSEQLGNIEILLNPNEPKSGDYITVTALDTNSKKPIVGDIWVYVYSDSALKNAFKYVAPFMVEHGYRYLINVSAVGYNPAQTSFSIGLGESKIIYEPDKPVVGDTLKIYYVDSTDSIIADATVKVNDEECDNPCTIENVNEGNYVVVAEKEGYQSAQASITVRKPLKVLEFPKTALVGQPITIRFEEPEEYSVVRGGNVEFSGVSNNITFTPDKAGNYTVYAREKLIGTITVSKGFSLNLKGTAWIILIVVIVLLIVLLLRGKKREKMKIITLGKYHGGALRTESEGE